MDGAEIPCSPKEGVGSQCDKGAVTDTLNLKKEFFTPEWAVFLAFSLTELPADLCIMLLRWLVSYLVLGLPALGNFMKMLALFILLDKVRRA